MIDKSKYEIEEAYSDEFFKKYKDIMLTYYLGPNNDDITIDDMAIGTYFSEIEDDGEFFMYAYVGNNKLVKLLPIGTYMFEESNNNVVSFSDYKNKKGLQ